MEDHESPRARPRGNECLGTDRWDPWAISLRRGEGASLTLAAAELVMVDVVAQHSEQPHEQLAGHGDLGFGAPAPMDKGEVGALEVSIQAGGMLRGLPKGQ